jgi:lipopolysaccharide export LptBFGC system permease protein LptF
MDKTEIKRTWKRLLIPFVIGIIVLISGILFHNLGSKRAGPQTLSLFIGVLGAIFIILPGIKMHKFQQYLKKRNK